MNEVEKMYSLAGVEIEFAYLECHRGRSSICCPIEEYEKDERCMGCINSSAMKEVYEYPLFTAEKQLELIKWLAYKMHITIGKGLPWGQYDDDWWTVTSKKGYAGTNAYKLEEALANFVNCLWQDLTDADKAQIKNILESEVRE